MKISPWHLAAVLLSVCFLGIIYGAVAVHLSWWPAGTVQSAKMAFKALSEVAEEEFSRNWPVNMESAEPSGAEIPYTVAHRDDVPADLIFVDGGQQQLRSYCPDYGCLGWVTNKQGEILHTWSIGPESIWKDLQTVEGINRASNIYSVGALPFPNGDLVVTYQGRNTFPYGVGIARFDKDSRLLWKKENLSHHWFSADDEGRLYTSVFRASDAPLMVGASNLQFNCRAGKLYEDVIVVLDRDGNELDSIPIIAAFVDAGYAGLVYQGKHPDTGLPVDYEECDPTHLNDVRVMSAADAATSAIIESGDLLVSLRSNNLIALIDPRSKKVKWVSTGRSILQHSPRYLGNDKVLVFDNLGGDMQQGGSRLLEIDMLTNAARTIYPPDTGNPDFFTATAGVLSLNGDRTRALASLTRQGRTLEIDLRNGELIWEYHNTHDVSGLADDKDGNAIASGRFATQTVRYFNEAAFEFNNAAAQ